MLARELARLLAVLDEARIPAIPLKGVTLAEALYGDPGLRVCSDIDILVPARNFAGAFRLFNSNGYGSDVAQPALLRVVARYGKDCELFPDDRTHKHTVELHCGLVWGGPLERPLLEEEWRLLRLVGKVVAAMVGFGTRKLGSLVRFPAESAPQAGFNLHVVPQE